MNVRVSSCIDYDWLYHHYVTLELSIVDVASSCGCCSTTIYRMLKKYNIITRSTTEGHIGRSQLFSSQMSYKDKSLLEHYYITCGYSISKVAEILQCGYGSISRWLEYYNIPIRSLSETSSGSHNAMYGKKRIFTPEWIKKMSDSRHGYQHSVDTRHKISISNRNYYRYNSDRYMCGPKNPNWHGGKSFEPYCWKFDEKFKEHVRDIFDRKCFLDGTLEIDNKCKLPIHHIDYDKNTLCDGKEWSHIPLCSKCHSRTNHNRWYWFSLLSNYWVYKYIDWMVMYPWSKKELNVTHKK